MLLIRVLAAHDLVNADWFSLSDPYAKARHERRRDPVPGDVVTPCVVCSVQWGTHNQFHSVLHHAWGSSDISWDGEGGYDSNVLFVGTIGKDWERNKHHVHYDIISSHCVYLPISS